MYALPCLSRRSSCSGFSLVELLVVIAIITLVATFSLNAISGTSSSQQLNAGGNRTVSLINAARQNAMSRHMMTALILLAGTNDSTVDNRVFVIEDYNTETSAWERVSKWDVLPQGVVADKANDTFLSTTAPTLNPAVTLPTLTYQGHSIAPDINGQTGYAYQIFLPQGQLLANTTTPPVLKLVSGMINNGAITYTGPGNAGSNPANYYQVTINLYTGMPKVFRP